MADQTTAHLATEDFVTKQRIVYELLSHIDQPDVIGPDVYAEGKKWDIQTNNKFYDSETAVDAFLNQYNAGMLPRGEIFSVFYPEILKEAVALFRLFRSAVDFETFWKTAAWAKIHVNEAQFAYAFSVAVVHRPDTKYVRLPTPDEIYPYFFFDSKVIRQAHLMKMKHRPGSDFQKSYVVPSDHSHSLFDTRPQGDPEHKLNYFTEDVGLNGYYHILNLEFPFWMSSGEFNLPKGYRGEQYYYSLKLLLTRYNLERHSNGLNEIEDIDLNRPITMGYLPTMTYDNGMHFPQRYHNSMVPSYKYKNLQEMKTLESRILEVIDSGFYFNTEGKLESIYSPGGLDFLGSMIEGNADSLNQKLYGSIDAVGRNVLGFNPDPLNKHKVLPSALQHFSTSLKDPGFYRLVKRILGYFERYKNNVERYTPEQLGISSGLRIESLGFDKLVTYFDYSDSIINNAVAVHDNDDANSFVFKARQYRLNHKPFSYNICIDSKVETTAMIRVFLGPKYNVFGEELDMVDNYKNFYEFDTWKVNLKVGRNEVKRNSHEAHFVLSDQEGKDSYYKKVKMAVEKREPLTYSEHVYGFPGRLLIPKGKKEGMTFKIFAHVIPCTKEEIFETDSPLWGKAYVDGHCMGYPLDRPMTKANYYNFENMYFKDIDIFHKESWETNVDV